MDIDPLENVKDDDTENATDGDGKHRQRLNNMVAVTIALLATFMGICKIKDDNIVQAMQQVQADRIDYWDWYQARNIRQQVIASEAGVMRAQELANPASDRAGIDALIAKCEEAGDKQQKKMDELKKQAQDSQKAYDDYNFRDDQFDLMEAGLAIAISMLAVTSLTQTIWLYWLSMVPTAFGVLMGLAGLLGWGLHPDILAKWLGT
jgi:hypothetical protein